MIMKSKRKTVIYMDQDTSRSGVTDKQQNWYHHNYSKTLGTKAVVTNLRVSSLHFTKKNYTTGSDITDV